jgi:hypothetical protein
LFDSQTAADAALTARSESEKRENAANSAPRPLAAARQRNGALEIVAPGGAARWRIVSGQEVEWSTLPATEWTPAALDSPTSLTAGASPSPSVCWIVGRGGAVYVTVDGMRFMRVSFPDMADLVAVTATDDRTAVVSSVDGRSWRTTDQGSTWSSLR